MKKKELLFICTNEQEMELEYLAFWIACRESHFKENPKDKEEIKGIEKNIDYSLNVLDFLKVPFWVQNEVLCFAEHYYDKLFMKEYLKEKNIYLWESEYKEKSKKKTA